MLVISDDMNKNTYGFSFSFTVLLAFVIAIVGMSVFAIVLGMNLIPSLVFTIVIGVPILAMVWAVRWHE